MVTPTFEERSHDAFGNLLARATRNNLDLASHYNFSPERLRLFRNGSREFPQYNTVSQFSDEADHWKLQPDAGDDIHIESAESGTYVVNYVIQASFTFQLNQSLSDGDVLKVGPRGQDGGNGWWIEQRGADHDDTTVDIKQLDAGSESTLVSNATLPKPTTEWNRYECEYNWYGVGNQVWSQTYTEDGEQINDTFTKSSTDGVRGPASANLNLYQEIEADSSTTGLELEVGSMGMITLGDPTSLNRDKPQYESITVAGTANAWEPILALRVDPDNAEVNMQFSQLDILNYGANDDIEVVVASFDAAKTNATGWGVPEYHHAQNSALQSTENVSQVANDAGTVQDFGTSDKYGGFTIASAVNIDGGNASGSAATVNQNRQEKKAILNSDHAVFLARTGTMDNVVDLVWDVDQNY